MRTFVIDMRHYLDTGDRFANIPGPAYRFREYVGGIVMAGTAWDPGQLIAAPRPCRRRRGRRPCPGFVQGSRSEVPAAIEWACSACDEHGIVHDWQGTPWDLSTLGATQPRLEVAVSAAEYRALLTINVLDPASERVVRSARRLEGAVLLRATEDDLDELAGFVAFEAYHTAVRARQRLLDSANFRIEEALRKADYG